LIGEYDAVLMNPTNDNEEWTRTRFAIFPHSVSPNIYVNSLNVALTDKLTVTWEYSPGHRMDWIGIYRANTIDLYSYLGRFYTGAKFSGQYTLSFRNKKIFRDEMTPGAYTVRLMRNDEYVVLAEAHFGVVERSMKHSNNSAT
jgi:hypothetical protein